MKYLGSLILIFFLIGCRKDDTRDSALNNSISLNTVGSWHFSSVPASFGESMLDNDIRTGMNRALISWYMIDQTSFYDASSGKRPANITDDDLSEPEVRNIKMVELFPSSDPEKQLYSFPMFNISYFPSEKGSWNYDILPSEFSAGIDAKGKLLDPQSRWGGITRYIGNMVIGIEDTLVFWIMDPFVKNGNLDGELYFDIGEVSEDVLNDRRKESEATLGIQNESTIWGQLGTDTSTTFNFPVENRKDYGLDGMNDQEEALHFNDYLNSVSLVCDMETFNQIQSDPANDDYRHFLWSGYLDANAGIIERYKRFNMTEGNSPTGNDQSIATRIPDYEDINTNGLLETDNNYFEYKVDIRKGAFTKGQNFISEIKQVDNIQLQNGKTTSATWYYFRVPLSGFTSKFGNPTASKLKFIRIFLTGFNEPVFLRFALLEFHLHQPYEFQ